MRHNRAAACIAACLWLCAPAAAQEGTRPAATREKTFSASDPFLKQITENLETIHTGKAMALRLMRQPGQKPERDDLLIDFENESLFSNPAHQSLIARAHMEREVHNGMNGMAARFTLRSHALAVKLPPYLHLSGSHLTREAGDFSFACEFEPNSADGEILRRENFAGGRHFLFSVALVNGRIIVKFGNLLVPTGVERRQVMESAELRAIDKVWQGKRNQLSLTYSEGEGRIRLQLNGREQEVFSLQRRAGDNYAVTFEKLSAAPLVLFSPFRGYADNIVFSNRVLTEEDIRHFGALRPYGDRYEQRTGKFLSALYDMGFSQSTVVAATADTETTGENHLAVSARCLDRRFNPALGEGDLKFEKIAAFGEKKCRFIQFRGIFTSDNAGDTSPLLRSIRLEYRQNPPPERPLLPKVISARNETLEIELVPNTELDVVRGGRYIIYYGHKAHQIEGAVYFASTAKSGGVFRGEKIAHKTPIRLKITNDTIAQNKAWADKNPRFRHRYPVLETGIGYYFWVTACDNAWGEAQELSDHESPPSAAVFARFE